MDQPNIQFADELRAAYPDAKVILSNRDVDKWVGSWRATVCVVLSWESWSWLAPWDSAVAGPWHKIATMMVNTFVGDRSLTAKDYLNQQKFLGPLRKAYLDHYEHVREITPKELLLEFKSEDGWEPLCEFLGVEVPNTPYPFVNESKDFVWWHTVMWYTAFAKMVAKTTLPAVVGAAAWQFWPQISSAAQRFF
jgi:hypothetical protein